MLFMVAFSKVRKSVVIMCIFVVREVNDCLSLAAWIINMQNIREYIWRNCSMMHL